MKSIPQTFKFSPEALDTLNRLIQEQFNGAVKSFAKHYRIEPAKAQGLTKGTVKHTLPTLCLIASILRFSLDDLIRSEDKDRLELLAREEHQKLRFLIKALGYSREDAGKAIGYSKLYLSHFTSGDRPLPTDRMKRLLKSHDEAVQNEVVELVKYGKDSTQTLLDIHNLITNGQVDEFDGPASSQETPPLALKRIITDSHCAPTLQKDDCVEVEHAEEINESGFYVIDVSGDIWVREFTRNLPQGWRTKDSSGVTTLSDDDISTLNVVGRVTAITHRKV
ncbi:helix-turn-helix domain-containing protein [Neptuniibacter sp. QD37_11]|uniref:helix-turn-helix domain-containing protein n=1 Tax=Neptuniibacter sp. QD37_11 TaxID=3398209 RepID=UPI0039F5D1C4